MNRALVKSVVDTADELKLFISPSGAADRLVEEVLTQAKIGLPGIFTSGVIPQEFDVATP